MMAASSEAAAVFVVIYRKLTAAVNFLSAGILGFRWSDANQNSGITAICVGLFWPDAISVDAI
jgi:hypothetical protein